MAMPTNQDPIAIDELAFVAGGARAIITGTKALVWGLEHYAPTMVRDVMQRFTSLGASKGGAELAKRRGWLQGKSIAEHIGNISDPYR